MSWDALPKGCKEHYEREIGNMFCMMTGKDYDHVSANPIAAGATALANGHSIFEYYTQPEKAIRWGLISAYTFGTLPFPNWNYAVYWNEDYGGTIKMPTGRMSAPGIMTYPAPTPELADMIEPLSPEDLAKGPTMKMHMRGIAEAEKFVGRPAAQWQFIYEPFVVGSFWVSPENMLLWVHNEPRLVHSIMKKVVTHSVNACEAVSKAYDGLPFMTACATLLANSSTMSVPQCKEFATDYLKDALQKIVKMGSTGIFYHQCGDHGQDYALCEDMPFPIGSVMHIAYDGLKSFDLTKAAKSYENKVALLGNTDTALMFKGDPKRIYEIAYDETAKYKHFKKGFCAGMACECPPFVPSANLMAWAKGVKDAGRMKE